MPLAALGPILMGAAGTSAAATAGAWTALGTGALTAGNLIGASKQSNAARDAANAQVAGANKSAELQAQSSREALAFQKQQAAQDQQNYVNTQLANYAQDTSRQQRIGQLGQMLGLGPRNIPPPPSYLTSQQGMPSSGIPGASLVGQQTVPNSTTTTAGADPKIASFIADWRSRHDPKEGIAPLAAAIAQQFPGVSRFDYGGGKLSNNELNVPGYGKYKVLGGEGGPGAYWYVPGTNDSPGASRSASAMQPSVVPMNALFSSSRGPLTPALALPRANPFGVS